MQVDGVFNTPLDLLHVLRAVLLAVHLAPIDVVLAPPLQIPGLGPLIVELGHVPDIRKRIGLIGNSNRTLGLPLFQLGLHVVELALQRLGTLQRLFLLARELVDALSHTQRLVLFRL